MRADAFLMVALTLATSLAQAATVETITSPDEPTIFAIEGDLEDGDHKKFIDKAISATDGIVVFHSTGGNLLAGIRIGEAIRLKGFVTLVAEGNYCASSCALAWLGGQPRFMAQKGRVGFHAAYKREGDKPRESGVANALVGAYLNSLGLSQRAVVYITETPPAEMRWLTLEEAGKHGIEVMRFEPVEAPPAEQSGVTPPPEPTNGTAKRPAEPSSQGTTGSIIRVQPPPSAALFDLLDLNAAATVQGRLSELGYFAGVIDGVWGPRSRIALRDFNAFNGLRQDERWTLNAQQALFSQVARVAHPAYQPPDSTQPTYGLLLRPFEPTPGTSLHLLNQQDAAGVQRRLREYGYYADQGDGIWGLASREALRTFKAANGLTPDDVWDAATEAGLVSRGAVHAAETPFGVWALTPRVCFEPGQRLAITATTLSAGRVICRGALRRSGVYWGTEAVCVGSKGEVPARIHVALVGGRLWDGSVLLTRTPSAPLSYVRCSR